MTPFKKLIGAEKERIKTIEAPNIINKNLANISYTYTINMYKNKNKSYIKFAR